MNFVVLVEDNEDNRDLVCAFLDGLYSVESFATGRLALDWFNSEAARKPALLLLDIALPGMDGVELLHRLRDVPELAEVPAIALTAHAMKGDEQMFLQEGFNAYVSKPILDEGRLLRTMRELIDAAATLHA